MTNVTNINDVLGGHVSLKVDCIDRILLNAYVPNLQVGGQLVTFLTEHLGFRSPRRRSSRRSAPASAAR